MKRIIVVTLMLCLLTCLALAEGILPVLQTPVPEITEAVSLHAVCDVKAVTPTLEKDGGYRYDYTKITQENYADFGRALAQEGFALDSAETAADGTVTAVAAKGSASVTVTYDCGKEELRAVYSPRVNAMEKNEKEPYTIREDAVSILPELPVTVSLHGATGVPVSRRDTADDGSRIYLYSFVPYECYARFSVKLAEAGFSLVAAEKTEDGTDRAVVTDGKVTLTVDYDQETKQAAVTYSPGVFARDAARYADYTEAKAGEPIPLMEGVTMTIVGWEPVDKWTLRSVSNMWIPPKVYHDDVNSGDGQQQIYLTIVFSYSRPEENKCKDMVHSRELLYGKKSIDYRWGTVYGDRTIYPGSDMKLSGMDQTLTTGLAFALTDSQMEHTEETVFSFSDGNYLDRYFFRLTEENRTPPQEGEGA